MPTYLALLRGINVSGQMLIPMERLRASFENLGFSAIETYIQSGNVVFNSARESTATVTQIIVDRILRDFGFVVPVIVRTPAEFGEVVKKNPFLAEAAIDLSKLHVTFLSAAAPQTATEGLQALAAATERFQVMDREIYLHFPDGYGVTKLSNAAIEKKLAVSATTRNWKTVTTLLAMAR